MGDDVTGWTPLDRLCASRGLDVPRAPAALPDVAAALDYAHALGMHVHDVLAIGGGEIPSEYLPFLRPDHPKLVGLRRAVSGLDRPDRARVRDFVRGLADRPAPHAPLPPLDPVTAGEVFVRLMRMRNLRIRDVARLAYLAESTVNRVARQDVDGERPAARLRVESMALIADALDLRHDDFMAILGRADAITGPPAVARPGAGPDDVEALGRTLGLLPLEDVERVVTFVRRLPSARPVV